METEMEKLLHYVWLHKLFPATGLRTAEGLPAEVIDPGLPNHNAGPDFFNAKVRLGGVLWAGNVEIHERSSDWYRHGHETDTAYNNTVLHVSGDIDREVRTAKGDVLPQVALEVPRHVADNYRELLAEEAYPPCRRVIPTLPRVTVRGWMSALATERLEEKTRRIELLLERNGGDWEQAFFVTLARNFGFGVNSDAFEEWAWRIPLMAVGKHRDDAFQVEAFFFGQAGLLDEEATPPERRDEYFCRLRKEYLFLAHKFSLAPMDAHRWRFLRMRPHNFPHIRLSQLVDLYHKGRVGFSKIVEADETAALRDLLAANATPYWEKHYSFGVESKETAKSLQTGSTDLLLINTVAPLLFAYGRKRFDEARCERAFELLEGLRAERNTVTRSWEKAGLKAENAADSQALIQLKRNYCDRKDCLRCRFGAEYIRKRTSTIG